MISNIINYLKDNAMFALIIASLCFIFVVWICQCFTGERGSYEFSVDDIKNPSTYNTFNTRPIVVKKYSKGETECRRVLENLFRKKFENERPDFMFNSETRRNLELDMYNRSEKLACEYNGRQHYEYVPYLHKNDVRNFQKQQERDIEKRRICNKLGIKLIEVPYNIKIPDIEIYLVKRLNEIGYKF